MNKLRELRKARGLAQQGLAVASGVSQTLIVMVERWDYRPTESVRRRLAHALDCTANDVWPEQEGKVDRDSVW
jgi:DNA-binding XRE family transcriptional regulator